MLAVSDATADVNLEIDILQSLAEIDPDDWNALGEVDYPFTCYQFLNALEAHHCLHEFGWQPVYFVLREDSTPVGAIACYIKHNSYGELVFDHAWAQAYERLGRDYYPKLVSAIPYTPATGPRFLLHPKIDNPHKRQVLRDTLVRVIQQFCVENRLSGWHLLFAREATAKSLQSSPALLYRYDCQFHWRNQNYRDFDDFLACLSSRKRKNIRKERASVACEPLIIERRYGHQLSDLEWRRVYQLYAGIFQRKYGTPTLTEDFFRTVGHQLEERVMVVLVRQDMPPETQTKDSIIATSLFFVSDSTLFGRVWGCDEYYNHLHFECCYYQGIEFCIEQGLQQFDPGAQGEHKISRGFLPTRTCSAHWLVDAEFHRLVGRYLDDEERYMNEYCAALTQRSPYRNDS